MSETLSYQEQVQTETVGDNLTAEEQDSLQVAESLESGEAPKTSEEPLLAGKYKSTEDLEKAYKELESKLGQQDQDQESKEEPKETKLSDGASLITSASDEWRDNNGKLSKETMSKFSEMSSADLLNAYMEVQGNPEYSTLPSEVTEASIADIKQSVGGDKEYAQVINWAKGSLPETAIQAYDQVVETGSVEAIKLAAAGLKAQYENANGVDGRMVQGKPPKGNTDVFRSQAELVRAMADPRYDQDPAYRQDIMEKLDRSDIDF